MRRSLSLLTVFVLQPVIFGCASHVPFTDQLREELVDRVEHRWRLILSRDFSGAWDFSTPAYREIFPQGTYYKNYHGLLDYELTGVHLLAYDSGAAVASVAVRVMISPGPGAPAASLAFGKRPSTIDEKWKLVGDNWYYVDGVK